MKIIVCSVKGNEPEDLEKKLHEETARQIKERLNSLREERGTYFRALAQVSERLSQDYSGVVKPLIRVKINELNRKIVNLDHAYFAAFGVFPDDE